MVLEIIGVVLILGILIFGWIDYRRHAQMPHIGVVMVKNRLKGANQSNIIDRT